MGIRAAIERDHRIVRERSCRESPRHLRNHGGAWNLSPHPRVSRDQLERRLVMRKFLLAAVAVSALAGASAAAQNASPNNRDNGNAAVAVTQEMPKDRPSF